MSEMSLSIDAHEQRILERFYAFEARLLDNREFLQWLTLLREDISYQMPARTNVPVNNRERGTEAMISVERELETEDSMGCPIREEAYLHLMLRAERAYKINSWGEQPAARTRRLVGNIELMAKEGDQRSVLSNFHLYYARPGAADTLYSGQRRDTLVVVEDSFKILRREIILDYANIEKPTLGLFF